MDISKKQSIEFISPEECPNIIIDMDEVVADTLPPILHHLNQIDRTNVKHTEITDYDFTKFFNTTQQHIQQLFHDNNILGTVEPLDGAIDALHRIKAMGYKIHIVTARAWHPYGSVLTMDWLERHRAPYNSISVSMGGDQPKSDVYKFIADRFAYIVDDGLHNITDAIESGIVDEVVVVEAAWNTSVDTFIDKTINSLSDFADFLEQGIKNGKRKTNSDTGHDLSVA